MPLMIEELSTSLEVQEEMKLRALIRDELEKLMREPRRARGAEVDPADPGASGRPQEGRR